MEDITSQEIRKNWIPKSEDQKNDEKKEEKRKKKKEKAAKKEKAVEAEVFDKLKKKRRNDRMIVGAIALVSGSILGVAFYYSTSFIFTDDKVSYYGIWFLYFIRTFLALVFAFLAKKVAQKISEDRARDGYYAATAVIMLLTFISVVQTYSPGGKGKFDTEHGEERVEDSIQSYVKRFVPITIYTDTITVVEENGDIMLVRVGDVNPRDGDKVMVDVTNQEGEFIDFTFSSYHYKECFGKSTMEINNPDKDPDLWFVIRVNEKKAQAIIKIVRKKWKLVPYTGC